MRIARPVMIIVPALVSASLCAALLELPVSDAGAAEMPAAEELTARVRAADQALKKAQGDLGVRRDRGSLSATDAADYRSYIQGLREHLAAECTALLGAGVASPPEVACAQLVSPAARSRRAGRPAATDAEHIEALDARLHRSIGEFDELLLRERERVKAARPPASDAGAGSSAGAGAGAGGGADSSLAGQASAAAQAGKGKQAGKGTQTGAGTKAASGPAAVSTGEGGGSVPAANTGVSAKGKPGAPRIEPDNIPNGNDDDVVARQLREAAQQETDPELKKKLWEEYRRYKRGTN